MKNTRILATLVVAAASAFAGGAASAGPRDTFVMTHVSGPPWGEHGFGGIALNASGMAVAGLILPDDFEWITGPDGKGAIYDLPGLPNSSIWSMNAINDAGQVAGSYEAVGGLHAFVTAADGSGYVDLNPPGAATSVATGVDTEGRVTGHSQAGATAPHRGFRNDSVNGSFQVLGRLSPGGDVLPAAIRNGVVVGSARAADGHLHAFRTGADGVSLVDLGTLGGAESEATAVNDAGIVVGWAEDAGGVRHAFITRADGSLRQLDADGRFVQSEARGIDAQGHVVGDGDLAGGLGHVAFVTRPHGGTMHDLNGLTHVSQVDRLESAVAINARGQILTNDFYDEHGPWLLTPSAASWRVIDGR